MAMDRPNISASFRLDYVRILVPGDAAWNHWAYWYFREILAGMTPEEIHEQYARQWEEGFEDEDY